MDVNGAFLLGMFQDGEQIYIEVPQGFEPFLPEDVVLLLLSTLYGLKQAALAYNRETNKARKFLKMKRSLVDPCVFFKWTKQGLVLLSTWIDDCKFVGPEDEVKELKKSWGIILECDDEGPMQEYIVCKIDKDIQEGSMRMTQPVIIQSFKDEFELPDKRHRTALPPGTV